MADFDIHIELEKSLQELKKDREILPQKIIESALAEKKYRTALSTKMLELEKEGKSATGRTDLAKGKCADECFERDVAKEMLKATYVSIDLDISINSTLKMMYDKEYSLTR